MKRGSALPSEDILVEHLKALFATRRRDVILGVGDDAAIVGIGDPLAIAADVLVEDADFRKGADPRRLGRKTLNVNLSDLAAMGAAPLYAVLVVGLPRWVDRPYFDAFAGGVREAAAEHGVAVVGGDLSASPVLFASITVLGRPSRNGALTRTGASPGDALYVSGTLGAADAGLRLLEAGYSLSDDKKVRAPKGRRATGERAAEIARLIRHQSDPRPMVELGQTLAASSLASSAMDVSDGLVKDLFRLCRASRVSAALDAALLPVDSALRDLSGLIGLDPLEAALYGGEDFGLLFTVPRRRLMAVEGLAGRFALRRIGTIVPPGEGARTVVTLSRDGRVSALADAGFDHFA